MDFEFDLTGHELLRRGLVAHAAEDYDEDEARKQEIEAETLLYSNLDPWQTEVLRMLEQARKDGLVS